MKKKFICTVCGYIYEGTEAPAECPVCHAKAEKFKEFDPEALKGTKTEQNLKTAFAGESQAHTKYLYYASKAKKDGFEQIAGFFEETARNEKEHAKIWFKFLHGGDIPTTTVNLADAAAGECRNCGHIVIGKKAPAVCPVCNHPQSFFQIEETNY